MQPENFHSQVGCYLSTGSQHQGVYEKGEVGELDINAGPPAFPSQVNVPHRAEGEMDLDPRDMEPAGARVEMDKVNLSAFMASL